MAELPTLSSIKMKGSDWTAATLLAVVAFLVLGYGLFLVLPFLVAMAANTIVFGIELAILGVMAIVLLDKGLWLSLIYKWKNISRNMRKAVIRENPLGVLDTVIERFAKKLEEIEANMVKAIAARKRQDATIRDFEDKQQKAQSLATAARKLGRPDHEVERQAIFAERWRKAAEDMRPMAATLLDMEVKMQQAHGLCQAKLEDMKGEREVLGAKLESMKQGQAAVKSLRRFFGTNPDLAMMQLSVDEIERQSSEAEAEIDEFMRAMTPAIEEADLSKRAESALAMAKFDKFLTGGNETLALPVRPGELVGTKESK